MCRPLASHTISCSRSYYFFWLKICPHVMIAQYFLKGFIQTAIISSSFFPLFSSVSMLYISEESFVCISLSWWLNLDSFDSRKKILVHSFLPEPQLPGLLFSPSTPIATLSDIFFQCSLLQCFFRNALDLRTHYVSAFKFLVCWLSFFTRVPSSGFSILRFHAQCLSTLSHWNC